MSTTIPQHTFRPLRRGSSKTGRSAPITSPHRTTGQPIRLIMNDTGEDTADARREVMVGVDALIFDVFGTVVDWYSTVTSELRGFGLSKGIQVDASVWDAFAVEWRRHYGETTFRISQGGEGPLDIDVLHREILDSMLESPRWSHLASVWSEQDKQHMNLVWHRLNGWPDASEGLYALKKWKTIATLSNGSVRLLVDLAEHADLPWDVVLSTAMFGTYKPNPSTYLGAARKLSLPPSKCAMIAAHIFDLRAAARHGMKTVYVRRSTEYDSVVKEKRDGGEVDIVVDSFSELAGLVSVEVE